MNDVTIQDRVKRLYQRTLGGGHLVPDAGAALSRLREECANLPEVPFEEPLFEPLGGPLCRLNLRPALRAGLSPETVNAMFVYSANHTQQDRAAFEAGLDALAGTDADRAWLTGYRAQGCPATSHSEAYRAAYHPAYRVVLSLFADAFPLVQRMSALGEGIVAIDGPCGSGKSTLAAALGETFGAGVVHLDDFFLRPEQRTPERLAEPGGNVDRERFLAEVRRPLQGGGDFTYRPYDCAVQAVGEPVRFIRTPVVLVEGAYCMHPDLRDAYALSAFVTIDPETQRRRIAARNGEAMLRRFENEWIPMENAYFDAFDIQSHCTVTIHCG